MAVQDGPDILRDNDLVEDDEEISHVKQSNYYDLDQFQQIMKDFNNKNNISVLNINARSLIKHFNEFSAILSDLPSSFDVITVEETWLSDTIKPLVELNGYTFITKHKSKCKEGGGIGIYVKHEIDFTNTQ